MQAKKTAPVPWYVVFLERFRFDRLYEYRKQCGFALLILVLLVCMISFFVSKSESACMSRTLKAEGIARRLSHPPAAERDVSYKEEFDTLCSLLAQSPTIANRFAGIAAQEELLQQREPSERWFTMAAKHLDEHHLPLYSAIVQATLHSEMGEYDKALEEIESVLAKSASEPKAHFYALLQKSYLLKKMDKSNSEVLDLLEKIVEQDPEISGLFEVWVRDTPINFFTFFRKEKID